MKKLLLCALCATLILSCVACGEKPCETHTDADWNYVCDVCNADIPLVNVDYTFSFCDQDGLPVSDVSFTLSQGSTTVATLTANENGVATGTIVAGPYTLTITDYFLGYYPEITTQEVFITPDTAAQTFLFENTIPNGSAARPFRIIEDETPYTLEPNQTLHFSSFGIERILRIESALVAVEANGTTYTADENGVVEVLLTAQDAREGLSFAVTNLDEENALDITLVMYSPLGSMENPYDATLNTTYTPTLTSGKTVYYIITAEEDGSLTFTTTSTDNNSMLYNLTSYRVTEYSDGALTLSVPVSQGDEVRVEIASTASAETVIDFTLTLAPIVEE